MSDEYPFEATIFGDYQLIRGLGHGGFADVYLGTDIRLGNLMLADRIYNVYLPTISDKSTPLG